MQCFPFTVQILQGRLQIFVLSVCIETTLVYLINIYHLRTTKEKNTITFGMQVIKLKDIRIPKTFKYLASLEAKKRLRTKQQNWKFRIDFFLLQTKNILILTYNSVVYRTIALKYNLLFNLAIVFANSKLKIMCYIFLIISNNVVHI